MQYFRGYGVHGARGDPDGKTLAGLYALLPDQDDDVGTPRTGEKRLWQITKYRAIEPGDYYITLKGTGVAYATAESPGIGSYHRAVVTLCLQDADDVLAAYDEEGSDVAAD